MTSARAGLESARTGTLDLPWRTFIRWAAAAVLLWAAAYVTLGYFGGSTFEHSR